MSQQYFSLYSLHWHPTHLLVSICPELGYAISTVREPEPVGLPPTLQPEEGVATTDVVAEDAGSCRREPS